MQLKLSGLGGVKLPYDVDADAKTPVSASFISQSLINRIGLKKFWTLRSNSPSGELLPTTVSYISGPAEFEVVQSYPVRFSLLFTGYGAVRMQVVVDATDDPQYGSGVFYYVENCNPLT